MMLASSHKCELTTTVHARLSSSETEATPDKEVPMTTGAGADHPHDDPSSTTDGKGEAVVQVQSSVNDEDDGDNHNPCEVYNGEEDLEEDDEEEEEDDDDDSFSFPDEEQIRLESLEPSVLLEESREALSNNELDQAFVCITTALQKMHELCGGLDTHDAMVDYHVHYAEVLLKRAENSKNLINPEFLREDGGEPTEDDREDVQDDEAKKTADDNNISDEQVAWESLEIARFALNKRLANTGGIANFEEVIQDPVSCLTEYILQKNPPAQGIVAGGDDPIELASTVKKLFPVLLKLGDMQVSTKHFADALKDYLSALKLVLAHQEYFPMPRSVEAAIPAYQCAFMISDMSPENTPALATEDSVQMGKKLLEASIVILERRVGQQDPAHMLDGDKDPDFAESLKEELEICKLQSAQLTKALESSAESLLPGEGITDRAHGHADLLLNEKIISERVHEATEQMIKESKDTKRHKMRDLDEPTTKRPRTSSESSADDGTRDEAHEA